MRISLVAILMVSAILAENILDVEALDEAKTMEGLDQGLNETLFGEEALDEIRTAEYLVKSLKDQQAYFDSKLDSNSSDVYSRDADPATTVEAMVEVADKPTDVIQKTKDISANISTVRSGGLSCDVNGWDGNQYCLCPNGQRISVFESHHHNHHEDRRWYLQCAVGPKYQIPNKRDWYTAQRANAYDGVLRWDGTSTNSFLVGMKSHHNNHHEDRQYTLFTATAKNWNLNQCSNWKQLNSYDHGIKYVLAPNEVIAAVYSHHSDHREDREFAIRVCFLSAVPASPACVRQDSKYSPIDDISGQRRTVEQDATACQTRCARVTGCSFFSFWAKDGGCHLSSRAAVQRQASGVTAGPSSCSTAGPCATFYEHHKYTGKSLPIQEGKTPFSMFHKNGFNDGASSIRVKSGCKVQYWEHGSYNGKTGTATQDTSYVGGDWNDKISSASCAC